MSTSIRCRLQLVSGDESRIGWDFKAISAIASEPERPEGGRSAEPTAMNAMGETPPGPRLPGYCRSRPASRSRIVGRRGRERRGKAKQATGMKTPNFFTPHIPSPRHCA